jgi:hypothetical protein
MKSFIGRPGSRLRRWLRAMSVVGATALSVFAGSMMLATAPAAASGELPEILAEGPAWTGTFEARVIVIANSSEQATCHVQYGTTTVSEHEVPCEQPTIEGAEQVAEQTLTGLTAGAEYKYRFVLKNLAAEEATGNEEPFTTDAVTPPVVYVPYAPAATTLEAHIEAIVDPENQESECHVQYGTTSVTENEVPCEQAHLTLPFPEPKAVSVTLTGLQAETKYTYRFVLKNISGEEGVGGEETFETALAVKPKVIAETTAWTGAFEARPEATVNPDNQDTECHLEYGKTVVSENKLPCEQATISASDDEQSVGLTLKGLEAKTKYHYLFVLKNASNEEAHGVGGEFETDPAEPPKVIKQSSSVKPEEATLSAEVNPIGQVTECHLDYGELSGSVTEHEAPCEPEKLEAPFGPSTVNATVTGLQSATKYHFQFVLKNASAEEGTGPEEEFETVSPVSQVETGSAQNLTSASAELTGHLNPGGEATYYFEYGTAPCIPGPPATCGERVDEASSIGKLQEAATPANLEFPTFIPLPLKSDTTYHYWLVADNSLVLEPIHGAEREFTTLDLAPAQIEVNSAEAVTTTSAVLSGALNPGGDDTSYYIEYGTEQCSGSTCGQKTAERVTSGETQEEIEAFALNGLKPNTVYYYWLVAKNDGVSTPVHGEANLFKTPATAAEAQAKTEAEAKAKAEAEAATSGAAARQHREEEERHREEAATALTNAQNKQYNEIAGVTASSKHQEEELASKLAHEEALIASTSVKIVKAKLTSKGVVVTIKVSQAGSVAVTGTGLETKNVASIKPGTHTLTITLSKAGKADRKQHKKATITVKLETSLTSVSASSSLRL